MYLGKVYRYILIAGWLCCLTPAVQAQGEVHTAQDMHGTTYRVGDIEFEMTEVKGDRFLMGAQRDNATLPRYDQNAMFDEAPVHTVVLSDYAIGTYPVTQELWFAVMHAQPTEDKQWYSENGYGIGYPAYYINYADATAFVAALNDSLHASGQIDEGDFFRLPTEAEWEYAARGGQASKGYKYAGSDTPSEVAWYAQNSPTQTHMVGQKKPNELGLYDMSGNVLEWCSDYYGDYTADEQTDPTGAAYNAREYRVVRGGCYARQEHILRTSCRLYERADRRLNYVGMRLVLRHAQPTSYTATKDNKKTSAHRIVVRNGQMYIEPIGSNHSTYLFSISGQRLY